MCCVLRLARFNLTKIKESESWKINFFEGIPSPAGGILILLPLIFDLSGISFFSNIKIVAPYFVVIVAVLLISKIPTFSFKKISIKPKLTIFILFGMVVAFVSLVFFTFETLLVAGLLYLLSIPLSFFLYRIKNNKMKNIISEDEHEDVL